MRVLHLPVTYIPWTLGGKEVYTHRLAVGLRERGVDARVALHQSPDGREPVGAHEREGVPVTVLPPTPDATARHAAYARTTIDPVGFEALLAEFRPVVVHFHDFSERAGLAHLALARAAGAATVMTYHSPGQSCLQRSLLRGGHIVCDGEIRRHRCTACRLRAAGTPRPLAEGLALGLPLDPACPDPLTRALTARAMTATFERAWDEMLGLVDRLHALSAWTRDVMLLNGAPPAKVRLIRGGGPARVRVDRARPAGGPLRVGFVGRCTPVKGVHVLVEAVRRVRPEGLVHATLMGAGWEDEPYGRDLLGLMAGDARFEVRRDVGSAEVLATLAGLDVSVVPSTWLENAPLAVLEAQAAGLPVLGSRLGGIPELVTDGVDGLLFPPGDAGALAGLLDGLARDPDALTRLRAGVRPPRTQADVARDAVALYEELVGVGEQAVPAL